MPLACGDSEENPNPSPNAGGEGGEPASSGGGPASSGGGPVGMLPEGISDTPETIECSDESCTSARVGLGADSVYLRPCCTETDNSCGLSTAFLEEVGGTFEESCQPKDQPGEEDPACPSPAAAMVPVGGAMLALDEFPGCCRPNGLCGVVVDAVTLAGLPLGALELGCVDAAPFFPGEEPVPCGEGIGGAGGSGAGGAPIVAGGNGSGGASGGAGGAN
jgi:hypothetical protein